MDMENKPLLIQVRLLNEAQAPPESCEIRKNASQFDIPRINFRNKPA